MLLWAIEISLGNLLLIIIKHEYLFFCQKSMKEFWVDKFTRLETIFSQVHNISLSKQNQNSGLIPASVAITTHGNYTDAWV